MGRSVFISYRREGGEVMAQLLHDRFLEKGFSVFYDIESLKSGPFNTKLLAEIEAADYVVVVLPPNGLDRCRYEEDWVRKEIRHALQLKKVIVPVMMRGFVFPPDLPDDIAAISTYNAVSFEDMSYLDHRINKIIELFEESGEVAGAGGHRRSGPSMISTVNTIGAQEENDFWPSHKTYSPIISMDMYNVMFFHATLIKPMKESKTLNVGYTIYDDRGAMIKEHSCAVAFEPGNDRFSIGWIIRGNDGSTCRAGRYRAEIWIDNSRVYEHSFALTSKEQEYVQMDGGLHADMRMKKGRVYSDMEQRVDELDRKLSRPKGLFLSLPIYPLFGVMTVGVTEEIVPMVLLGIVGMIVFWTLLTRYTKKWVVDSVVLAFLIAVPGLAIYMIYLLLTSIACWTKGDKWRAERKKFVDQM